MRALKAGASANFPVSPLTVIAATAPECPTRQATSRSVSIVMQGMGIGAELQAGGERDLPLRDPGQHHHHPIAPGHAACREPVRDPVARTGHLVEGEPALVAAGIAPHERELRRIARPRVDDVGSEVERRGRLGPVLRDRTLVVVHAVGGLHRSPAHRTSLRFLSGCRDVRATTRRPASPGGRPTLGIAAQGPPSAAPERRVRQLGPRRQGDLSTFGG